MCYHRIKREIRKMFTYAFHCVKCQKSRVLTRKNASKNMPVAMLLEPAVGYGEEDFFHGDVPFPAQVGQETERNKNFSGQTRGIY